MNFASNGFIYAFSSDNPPDMMDSNSEYDHDDGGFVYRGQCIPELQDDYVFGDYSDGFNAGNGRVRHLDESYTADPHERTPKVFTPTPQCAPGAECLV